MLEKDPNDVPDSAGEKTALLSSGELENAGLTTSNGVEVANLPDFPQPSREINIGIRMGKEPRSYGPQRYLWL
jgi:hypothetical protein